MRQIKVVADILNDRWFREELEIANARACNRCQVLQKQPDGASLTLEVRKEHVSIQHNGMLWRHAYLSTGTSKNP